MEARQWIGVGLLGLIGGSLYALSKAPRPVLREARDAVLGEAPVQAGEDVFDVKENRWVRVEPRAERRV